jgi:hypothetical protein
VNFEVTSTLRVVQNRAVGHITVFELELQFHYVEINQQNSLNSNFFIFFLRWLLQVSAKPCLPQGATMFLSEPLQRQYGSRRFTCDKTRRYVGSVIRPVTCLLPYRRWSGSDSNIVAPWWWYIFAETCGSHRKNNIKKYRIQSILLFNLYVFENARYKNQNCSSLLHQVGYTYVCTHM